MHRFPELGKVTARCHTYKIRSKYTYKCVDCGSSVNRHSKSVDVERKVCGRCGGKFELLVNRVAGAATPMAGRRVITEKAQQGTPANKFAAFVKQNYKHVRTPGTPHRDAMKELGRLFAAAKVSEDV